MNNFEKHGVGHVSASLINSWIEHPALTLLKIAGIDNGEAGPAAWRGISAEHAMNIAAEQQLDFGDLVKAAQCKFDEMHENAEENHDEQKIERERKALEDYARTKKASVSSSSKGDDEGLAAGESSTGALR